MEKRTLLAVVLSVVVISASYFIQGIFSPAPAVNQQPIATEQTRTGSGTSGIVASSDKAVDNQNSTQIQTKAGLISAVNSDSAFLSEQKVVLETDLVRVTLTNKGGDVVSYKLKEHRDGKDFVEMVLPGEKESHAFRFAFGDLQSNPVTDLFNVRRVSDYAVEFYKDYAITSGSESSTFRLIKRYDFKPGEYIFELSVGIDGGYAIPNLNSGGPSYTLEFGPQIGPHFVKLAQRYEYRNYYTFANDKRKQEKVNTKGPTIIDSRVSWAAIAGKYFTAIAIPDATQYQIAFSSKPEAGISEASRMFFIRPNLSSAKTTDIYKFYLGPKTQNALAMYDISEKNAYKLRDLNLTSVANTSGILGPLEVAMKWFLMIFYKVIPNYGIAIILLTILVKAMMFPLTKKSSESTLRMQALSPKIKEIQEKHKDNSTKMNTEMAELYKREGYNPMSGCLPMLLQIPIFFAMYNLFNNHFDLRGALFIPGWIPDLSLPETVWSFAPFSIPLLNWSDLRLLPFIYLGSQLLYGKVTQTPDQQGNAQMKMMLYLMPIMFFFILYDVPSGLLLYWIMSNVLTMVQQLAINKYLAKRRAHMAATQSTVIAPNRRKK